MNEQHSLSSARLFAPADFRRWVLGGILISLVGYTVISLVGIWQYGFGGQVGVYPQMTAGFICFVALIIALRGHELTAGVIALVATWLELHYGFAITRNFPSSGTMVVPVLMLGMGLLLGTRVAFVATIVSIVATVTLHRLSPALQETGFTSRSIYWMTLYTIVMIAAWVLLAISLSGFVRVFRELRTKERELSDTIRFAPDGILLLDGMQNVVLANPAAEAVLDLPRERIVGRRIAEVLAVASRRADESTVELSDDGEMPVALQFMKRDGTPVHVEAAWRRMEGDRRQLLLRDVSERVRADAARRTMEAQLAHTQRLEAVGQLAGSLSHDFNNILTTVGGSAELLRGEQDPGEQASLLREILAARDRGASLTRQLLAFARRELIQPRVVDLSALVRTRVAMLRRVLGDDCDLRMELGRDCRVRADVEQLEQALTHLVANARAAMPTGGTCTVLVQRITDGVGMEWVQVHVDDTGGGMSDHDAAHAFEPFFSRSARGQGTGLGLAAVHGTAVQSGGTARIESVTGRGTRVTLELPAVNEPVETIVSTPPTGVARTGPFTILVAEDDDAARSIVERMLRRAGYEVIVAPDGALALHVLESGGAHIDLLLTDVMMPVLNGLGLATRAREVHPQLPVLFMSGYAEEMVHELSDWHADRNLITKPFKGQLLLSRVAELLHGPSQVVVSVAN